jgi:hypothetical protein
MFHCLVIHSLRDTSAACTCGEWHYATPTADDDSDEQIAARINAEFQQHLRHRQQCHHQRRSLNTDGTSG